MGTSWENNDMEESLRKDTVAAEAETGDEENKAPACCCRTKVRTEKEQKDMINRLSRIEGQVRGIRRMLEEDAYCIDIINQVAAANAALNSFTKVLLANHIHTCVTEDVQAGNNEKVDELVKTLQKLMK
jgi:DNA-binding FrmR family transcriptional regulator